MIKIILDFDRDEQEKLRLRVSFSGIGREDFDITNPKEGEILIEVYQFDYSQMPDAVKNKFRLN